MHARDPLRVVLRTIFVLKRLVAVPALHLERVELELLEEVNVLAHLLELFLLLQQVAPFARDRPVPLELVVEALRVAGRSTGLLGDYRLI